MAPAFDADTARDRPMQRSESSGDRGYPHFEDLVVRAIPKTDTHTPIRTLLQQADECAKRAETYLSFNRPDLAYVEYLMAFNIVVDLVPRHKDFPMLHSDREGLWRLNKGLQNKINTQHDKFEKVQELIKADNARRGVKPTILSVGQPHLSNNFQSSSREPSPLRQTQAPYDAPNAIAMPDAPRDDWQEVSRPTSQGISDGGSYDAPQSAPQRSNAASPLKRKPLVVRKPDNLRGQLPYANGKPGRELPSPTQDPLMERFAKLRNLDEPRQNGRMSIESANHIRTDRPSSVSSSFERASSANTASSVQFTPSSSTSSLPGVLQAGVPSKLESPARVPKGPRQMPHKGEAAPPHPPKLPLNTDIRESLPRPPSPTYSPARNLPAPATVDPPRTSARSLVGTGGRSSSVASARTPLPQPEARRDALPPAAVPSLTADNRKAAGSRRETSISAEELFRNLKRGSDTLSVLLIDVRAREAFDDGHIFAPSIICIEPIALRPRMSAEEVGDALVLSPDQEQRLFHHRHTFDLVVYYDQCSGADRSSGRSTQSPSPVYFQSLREALLEFNHDKPLKRVPVLLEGGLEAWTDLVGPQALKTSNTTLVNGRRRQTPVAAPPSKQHASRIGEGRPHDHIHAMDRRNGSLGGSVVDQGRPLSAAAADREAPVALEDDDRSYPRTYDDFLRRFPEPSEIKASMVTSSPVLERSIIDHPFHNFTGVGETQHHAPQTLPPGPPAPSGPPSRPPPAVPRQSYSGVSERAHYSVPPPSRPPPLAPSGPTALDTISSRPAYQIGRTGLTNFGATCYMNSVMQCLSATSPLTRYFLDGSFKGAVQRNGKFGSKGELPEVYANLMWHLWSGNYTHISPKSFRDMVSRLNRDFENPDVQHDANDFFIFLLGTLHEDLNLNCSRNRLNDLTPAEERKREGMPVQVASRVEWNRWSHQNASWISNLFGGQHLSRLQCPVCGGTSTSYETFYTISLEIPRKGQAHLYDCLKNYTKEERLGPDEAWTCPTCKVPRQASKRITITRAPQILVIQLKRFKSVRRGFTDKNNAFVDFPLTGLDLTPFCVPPLTAQAAHEVRARYGAAVLEPDDKTTPPFEYNAYGVVQHFGTLTGGHYTALVRGSTGGGQWFEFNDRMINNFGSRHIQSPAAYLLFYVRSKVQ